MVKVIPKPGGNLKTERRIFGRNHELGHDRLAWAGTFRIIVGFDWEFVEIWYLVAKNSMEPKINQLDQNVSKIKRKWPNQPK